LRSRVYIFDILTKKAFVTSFEEGVNAEKAGVDLSKIETIEAVAKQFDLLLDKLEAEIEKL